jgi:hypothetical protein
MWPHYRRISGSEELRYVCNAGGSWRSIVRRFGRQAHRHKGQQAEAIGRSFRAPYSIFGRAVFFIVAKAETADRFRV